MILLAIGLITGVIAVNAWPRESAHQILGEGCLQNTLSPYCKDTSQLGKDQQVIVDVFEYVVRDDKVETLRRIVNRQHINRFHILILGIQIACHVPARTPSFYDLGKPALRRTAKHCRTYEPVNDCPGDQDKQQTALAIMATTIWTPEILSATAYRLQSRNQGALFPPMYGNNDSILSSQRQ